MILFLFRKLIGLGIIAGLVITAFDTHEDESALYPCCPYCESNLYEQEGFSDDISFWECRECGAMLLPPDSEYEYAWFCDECDAFLNDQEGFSEDCGTWKCSECGSINNIDVSEVEDYGYTVCNNQMP